MAVLRQAAGADRTSTSTPTVVADSGVENVNGQVEDFIENGTLRRVLTTTDISFSNSLIEAWWRSLKHQWLYLNSLDSVSAVTRLTDFYVGEHKSRLPHSAFNGQTPDELYFGGGERIPGELKVAREAARRARLKENRAEVCGVCNDESAKS